MALKRALYITYGDEERCSDTRRFIEDAGIDLDIRDIKKNPLTEDELKRLLGWFEITHFLNPGSPSFEKNGLDKTLPDRADILRMIVEDQSLLRRPIIKAGRLLTVGCDRRKIADMLQISANGKGGDSEKEGQAEEVSSSSTK
jgi:arsenate reductase-like glutaredoxin family protein